LPNVSWFYKYFDFTFLSLQTVKRDGSLVKVTTITHRVRLSGRTIFPLNDFNEIKRCCKERLDILKEIQKKWKNDGFINDWNKYITEDQRRSLLMRVTSQRSNSYEVSSYSLQAKEATKRKCGPYTPDKFVIQQLKQLYSQVSFTKRAKIVSDKLHNENLVKNNSNQIEESENDDQIGKQGNHNENEENRDDHDNQDQVVAVDWREWLENILEVDAYP
ncbi:2630_t:CDS:2, partial [Acaulospora morrowiae]